MNCYWFTFKKALFQLEIGVKKAKTFSVKKSFFILADTF